MGKSNKMDDGIGWAISRLVPSGHNKVRPIKKLSVTSKWCHNEFKVRICPTCGKVWDWNAISNRLSVMYHENFPKLGLQERECFICNPDNYKGGKEVRVTSSL